jgi:hypothetical protein
MALSDDEIIINDMTVEMVASSLNMPLELAQQFIDLSIERGIIVPVENGYYRAVSKEVIRQAKDLVRKNIGG